MGCKLVWKVFKICNYGMGKKTFKKKKKKKKKGHIYILHHLRIEYTYYNLELYKGQLIEKNNWWNLKLGYLNQFQWIIVTRFKISYSSILGNIFKYLEANETWWNANIRHITNFLSHSLIMKIIHSCFLHIDVMCWKHVWCTYK